MHEISFGTRPMGTGELQQVTELLARIRVGAGDFEPG
jgi:hypothetical protein